MERQRCHEHGRWDVSFAKEHSPLYSLSSVCSLASKLSLVMTSSNKFDAKPPATSSQKGPDLAAFDEYFNSLSRFPEKSAVPATEEHGGRTPSPRPSLQHKVFDDFFDQLSLGQTTEERGDKSPPKFTEPMPENNQKDKDPSTNDMSTRVQWNQGPFADATYPLMEDDGRYDGTPVDLEVPLGTISEHKGYVDPSVRSLEGTAPRPSFDHKINASSGDKEGDENTTHPWSSGGSSRSMDPSDGSVTNPSEQPSKSLISPSGSQFKTEGGSQTSATAPTLRTG